MKSQEEALGFFNESKMGDSLNEIYSAIPQGSCKGSTRCCCESVNCFYSEYLHVIRQLKENGTYEEFSKRAIRYWLCELSIAMKCPFLKTNGLCEVYEARPLPCRVFGHLKRSDFELNIEAIREQNSAVAEELLDQYGIVVPKSVTVGQVGFCENFCTESEMSSDDRDDLIDRLFGVESRFLNDEYLGLDEFNLSLTQWFAYERFGRENAIEMRIKISQEFTKFGDSETLLLWEKS